MHVYKLNEYEWWVGPSLEEVKRVYLKTTGVMEEEAFDDPCQLSDADLDTHRIQLDGPEDECSFRVAMTRMLAEGYGPVFPFAMTADCA